MCGKRFQRDASAKLHMIDAFLVINRIRQPTNHRPITKGKHIAVVTGFAVHEIHASTADERVITLSAIHFIAIRSAFKRVVTIAAIHTIHTCTAQQHIIPAIAVEQVITIASIQKIVAMERSSKRNIAGLVP